MPVAHRLTRCYLETLLIYKQSEVDFRLNNYNKADDKKLNALTLHRSVLIKINTVSANFNIIKGQLISKGLFGILNSSKNERKNST